MASPLAESVSGARPRRLETFAKRRREAMLRSPFGGQLVDRPIVLRALRMLEIIAE